MPERTEYQSGGMLARGNMKKMFLSLPVCLLSGCAVVTPHPTSMTLSPQAMEIVGPATGESSSTRVLCVLPVNGNASLIAATENALKSVAAEALVNPMVDDERGFGLLGLWCWQKIRVSGTAIRFKRNTAALGVAASEKRAEKSGEKSQPKGGVKAPSETEDQGLSKTDVEALSDMENRIFKKGQ